MAHQPSTNVDQEQQDKPALADLANGAPPFWEWVVAGVGLVLLLASLGYFSYAAVGRRGDQPAPVVAVLGVQQQGGRFVVLVRVSNRGRTTAAEVKVSGFLKRGSEVVEESETQFQYLPGESSREGGLFFSRNPRDFELELVPRSYQKP